MRILLTFDTNYAPHAATVMESIIQNCPEKLDFVIIYYKLSQEIQEILTIHFTKKVNSLEFVQMDEEKLIKIEENINIIEHWSLDIYMRLFATILLPNDKYVIYLDCDIIVQDNILKILDEADLSKPICAVTEYDPNYKLHDLSNIIIGKPTQDPWIIEAYWYRTFYDLEMDKYARYFNTGVMVMNLDYWRENKITEKTMNFIKENPEKIYYPDQDALNAVINGNYSSLDLRWNFVPPSPSIFSNYTFDVMKKAVQNPAIIHLAGSNKPWSYLCDTKYKIIYRNYRKYTPWPKIVYKDRTMKNMFKKYIVRNIEKVIGVRILNTIKAHLPGREKFWISKVAKLRVHN